MSSKKRKKPSTVDTFPQDQSELVVLALKKTLATVSKPESSS
jgi:hypothetical protein